MFSRKPDFWLALLTLLMAMAPYSADAQLSSEQDVKAAFLVNFATFTEWPAAIFADTAEPIVIGVAGNEMLRRTIDHIARGKLFGGRTLGRQPCPHHVDRLPELEQLADLVGRKIGDERPPSGLEYHEPLVGELAQTFPDRAAADLERGGELDLGEPLPGRVPAGQDVLTDDSGGLLGVRRRMLDHSAVR